MEIFSEFAAAAAVAGMVQALAGWWALRRFRAQSPAHIGSAHSAVTVLKPMHGDEPLLEAALASLCAQDYSPVQIVFGVQDRDDAARAVITRIQTRFPDCDIAVVIDPTRHGKNQKIANLINMLPMAKHDLLVIADSDVWWPPGTLTTLATTLARPGVGLATALYTGRPASPTPGRASLTATLGTAWINHVFLPGALPARRLGRQDCLGATMALRRETLTAVGGLAALADHLADDQMLGRKVRALGLDVALAPVVVATTVPEATLGALFAHELRWGRTIRALEPVGFALSALQHPLAWAILALALSGGAEWAVTLFIAAWAARIAAAHGIDRELAKFNTTLATRVAIWLFPLRDLLSMTVLLASHLGNRVEWRGQFLHTTPAPQGSNTR